jgi:hypothetical protein
LALAELCAVVRNCIIASLEILTGVVDDLIGGPGAIQKNIRDIMPQYLGITMDIPHGAREPLT